jgi:fatty-acyl-CoA synthase
MNPQRLALFHEGRAWTYAQLSADIARLAHGLSGLGVRAGDRVGYLGPNHPACLQTFFAAGLLGAIFVPLNHGLSATELVYIVQDSGCDVVVHAAESSAVMDEIQARSGVRECVAVGAGDGARRTLDGLLAEARSDLVDLPVGLDDLCFLIYTSGTTGDPKGVMLTHGNVTWNALNYLSTTDFRANDVTLAIAPLFRAGGWGVTLLPTLHRGGTVVLVSDFDPAGALELVPRHRVTTLFGGPELLAALVRTPTWARADLSSVRFVISGGDVVHESLIRAYADRGVAFLQGYGLTEAGPMALMLDEQDALRKLGSAGMPPLFVDVRIARSDLSDAEAGEVGEILVRGPNVMRGYWRRPEDSEAALVQGWLRTGDAGRTDEEGYVYVVDRLKHLFVSHGENVFPAEVERALTDHTAVAEAAVVATDDERAGQVGTAYVVLADRASTTARELLTHCRERLPWYQVPVSIQFREELPKNAAGKVLRSRLSGEAPGG